MFDADKWQEIWATIRKNKLRTFLTASGVFWGMFMLVLMLGFGNSLQSGVSRNMRGFAMNSVYLWGQRTSLPYQGMQPGRPVRFTSDDIVAIGSGVDEIRYLAPRNQLGGHRGGASVTRDTETGSYSVMGDFPEIRHVVAMNFDEGRFINPFDIQQRRKVVVIGSGVKEDLFKEDESAVGKDIKVNGVYFQVVGVVSSLTSGDRGERQANTVHVPFTTFQQAFNFGNRVGWFAIVAKDNASSSVMEANVKKILAERHKISPNDAQAIGGFNAEKRFGRMKATMFAIQMTIWVVGIVTLLAGVIGVSNIMLIVVRERTKEIGIRKAIGAQPRSIIALILQESVVLTSLAGYMGVVAGVFLLELVAWGVRTFAADSKVFAEPFVDVNIALFATVILVVFGAIAGIMPARKAVRINPVEALRAE